MATDLSTVDLAVIGAGTAGCALAAALRLRGWSGSITLLEIGRGTGGRTATRRSRRDPSFALNHGAPLFNISANPEPRLLEPLRQGGWIAPFKGAIYSLDGDGRLGAALPAPLSSGALWQGSPHMDGLCRGLLSLAQQNQPTRLMSGTLVRQLEPLTDGKGWRLYGSEGQPLLDCHWLVLSGTLLADPRCQGVFGWSEVPLQRAADQRGDPQLLQASAALAAIKSTASSNLLLSLGEVSAAAWRLQPWSLLQFTPDAQERWGIRRVSLQAMADGRWGVVVESSAAFAERHLQVHGSRSSAAQVLGAAPQPQAEAQVIKALDQALQDALNLSTAGGEGQLMRWGAAFPKEPGLPPKLSLCPDSHIGFCGDAIAGLGFGRVEGALRSAEALAEQLQKVGAEQLHSGINVQPN
ncbi:NAD(P)-binding protein [Vulcanococcus sp. Clear-D1]|uniref:NAD(P)-binding protein n=1 Tax=Vulcanococcus sp. Clear-D1 TaxID=2766970 RepID=UPI0019C880D2|nr:NAD(P)-binding protein [Vulcanococcus sp. Clear-D1]MBD1192578.1 NAD(P)-binding protein [Vulcanococcus sp. Clear-D1]